MTLKDIIEKEIEAFDEKFLGEISRDGNVIHSENDLVRHEEQKDFIRASYKRIALAMAEAYEVEDRAFEKELKQRFNDSYLSKRIQDGFCAIDEIYDYLEAQKAAITKFSGE